MGETIIRQRICIAALGFIILTHFSTPTQAVAGGELANFGDFPHLVQMSLSITGQFFCGGSILEENVILTAAHCLHAKYPNMPLIMKIPSELILVTAGSLHLRGKSNWIKEGEELQTRRVSGYILHPDYDLQQVSNDIALLFLTKPFNFSNEKVQPIQLPFGKNQSISRGTFAGWGNTDGWTLKISNHLKKLNIVFGETKLCEAEFSSWGDAAYHFNDNHICSKFLNGTGICHGDSGSSLVCEEQRFYLPDKTSTKGKTSVSVICGVASWVNSVENCGLSKSVVAFTNVAKYLDWIYATTKSNGFFIKNFTNSSERGTLHRGAGYQCIPNFQWFIFVFFFIVATNVA